MAAILSDDDRKLIGLLAIDGRRTYVQLAEQMGRPLRAVTERVAELRDEGLLRIAPIADPRMFGYEARAGLLIKVRGAHSCRRLATELVGLPFVSYVSIVAGPANIYVSVLHETRLAMINFLESTLSEHDEIESYEVLPYAGFYHYRGVGVADERPERFSSIDRAIIQCLSDDGRVSFRQIGSTLGISEAQVRKRFQRMRESRSLVVVAIVNPLALGLRSMAIVGIRARPPHSALSIAQALAGQDFISWIVTCTGSYDLLGEFVAPNPDELFHLVDQQVRSREDVSAVVIFENLELLGNPHLSEFSTVPRSNGRGNG